MSIIGSNILAGASGQAVGGGYAISRSLRFTSADSAYLSRTFGSPTDQDIFTFALWVKRSALGSTQQLFGVSTNHGFGFTSGDALNLTFGGSSALTTTALFRDPSAWYHIVWKQNANAHELYVNGVSVGTATATSNTFNTAAAHQIGAANTTNYFSGYLADIHFIDGQALDPTSFGEFDDNGIWQPIDASGLTYGTNGFHLDFADNASTTTIGYDAAGSNDWTANNLSVTAGAGNDSLVDVPTNGAQTDTGAGGEVRGNYATFNPLDKGANISVTNGNLTATVTSTGGTVLSTFGVSSGKWYWEMERNGGTDCVIGIARASASKTAYLGSDANGWGYVGGSGNKVNNASSVAYGTAYASGVVVGVALDMDAGTVTFYRNGTSQGIAYSGLTDTIFPAFGTGNNTDSVFANFGQRPFAYTAPSGFKALNTANLPAPVVTKPSTVFDVLLWSGDSTKPRTLSGLNFDVDLIWVKARSDSYNHWLQDSVRGFATGKKLRPNGTDAEGTGEALDIYGYVSGSSSTGFTIDGTGTTAQLGQSNLSGQTYVGWAWDAGSSTVTNTVGSISSQVRANASAGFSVVGWNYPGGTGASTIGHGLGVKPGMIILKNRDTSGNWIIYHSGIGATKTFRFTTAAASTESDPWNNTEPTSTVFSIGAASWHGSGNIIAYCFAPVAGYSSFGSYIGNGSSDGVFVYTGFRPRYIMMKSATTTTNWWIHDAARSSYNAVREILSPNLSNAEDASYGYIDFLSNGFKLRFSNSDYNTSSQTYIYCAFAESPFGLNNRAR